MDERQANLARFLEGNHPEVPHVLYHGTGDDFAEFMHGHPNKKDKGWLGKGFYFTNSTPLASSYAMLKRGEDKNVMPVHVALKNPFFAKQEHKEALRAALMDDPFAADDFREQLIKAGHDGVILDYGTPDGGKEVVAFHPTQIKSAIGNQGTFDPENPDITKATCTRSVSTRIPIISLIGIGRLWIKANTSKRLSSKQWPEMIRRYLNCLIPLPRGCS